MDLKPLIPLVAALLGGLFSYWAVFKTQRITQQRERMQYQCSKLERGYLLAHALYDGHKAELDKLAAFGTMSGADWLRSRKHPGETMSELKMIVAMYAPQLESRLDAVDTVHQVLKEKFSHVDKQARNNPGLPQTKKKRGSSAALILGVEKDLEMLGLKATDLKLGFVAGVQKIMKQYAGSSDLGWTLQDSDAGDGERGAAASRWLLRSRDRPAVKVGGLGVAYLLKFGMRQLRAGEAALLRGYLVAVLMYVAGHVALWSLVYRHDWGVGASKTVLWAVIAAMWIGFIGLTAWLALTPHRKPVIAAALVSCAAVFTAGLARTVMAALGMREFLCWDHDNVVVEAALEQVFVAVLCFPPALVVAAVSRLLFGRSRSAVQDA